MIGDYTEGVIGKIRRMFGFLIIITNPVALGNLRFCVDVPGLKPEMQVGQYRHLILGKHSNMHSSLIHANFDDWPNTPILPWSFLVCVVCNCLLSVLRVLLLILV